MSIALTFTNGDTQQLPTSHICGATQVIREWNLNVPAEKIGDDRGNRLTYHAMERKIGLRKFARQLRNRIDATEVDLSKMLFRVGCEFRNILERTGGWNQRCRPTFSRQADVFNFLYWIVSELLEQKRRGRLSGMGASTHVWKTGGR